MEKKLELNYNSMDKYLSLSLPLSLYPPKILLPNLREPQHRVVADKYFYKFIH